jgi:integrase
MKAYVKWMDEHPEVKAWLKDRPQETQRAFAERLREFSREMCVSPEEWRNLDKFKARDLAWQFVKTKIQNNPSVASTCLAALKGFYRNKDGEALPFDSARGGKHYFHNRLKKAAIEHIPNKAEMYQIIDMASNLRDKSILLFLFQTGCRVNVVQHLKLKHIMDQLDKDTFVLKITPELDFKLRGRDIPFYYTFLNGEGAETLKRYVALAHKKMNPEAYLFYTRSGRGIPISEVYVLQIVKNCVKKAGLNEQSMWTHSIRKAFRKIVRQADIDDDDKEQLMGHVIRGSRQSYYDAKDVDVILAAYRKCNFTREVPKGELEKLREQLLNEHTQRALNEEKINSLETQLYAMQKTLKQLLEQKA